MAVAEKYEVPSFHPTEQVARLGDVIRGNRLRGIFEQADDHTGPLAHRGPVGDGRADVG